MNINFLCNAESYFPLMEFAVSLFHSYFTQPMLVTKVVVSGGGGGVNKSCEVNFAVLCGIVLRVS